MEGDKFRWKPRSKLCLYGLNRLSRNHDVILAEGESDAQTLWFHGFNALGIPGATNWREDRDAAHLEGFAVIYVVIEPDNGGAAVLKWLEKSSIRHRAKLLRLPTKDPSALHLSDQENFKQEIQNAMQAAQSWKEFHEVAQNQDASEAWRGCKSLAQNQDILSVFRTNFAAAGVVGEEKNGKILFLAMVSRMLEKPISVVVKGPSSGGKSFTVEIVLKFFPPEAYYALSAMSDRALAYSQEPLSHRIMVIFEAAGMTGDFVTYLMRSLLSEGCIKYETVEKTAEGMKPRLIQRDGPTGLIVTTTARSLHPENETRLLSLTVTDTPEQTKSILMRTASKQSGNSGAQEQTVDFERWHALQRWLELGEHRVVIPYADTLAELVPPVATRQRRDFGQLLRMIEAHALLHRASRKINAYGAIVAEIQDYVTVHALIADVFAEGLDKTVKETTRETVQAVEMLLMGGKEHVSTLEISSKLRLDKGTASRRVGDAIQRGYLVNGQAKRGQPAQIRLGDPMPKDQKILPDPEELALRCSVAMKAEGIE